MDKPTRRIPVDGGTATLVEETRRRTFHIDVGEVMLDATLAEIQPETAQINYRDDRADEVIVFGPRTKTGTRGRITFTIDEHGQIEPHWRLGEPPEWLRQLVAATMTAGATVEHALKYAGGSMLVRPAGEHIEAVAPLAEWIAGENRTAGGSVFRRRVIVLDDWQEVPR